MKNVSIQAKVIKIEPGAQYEGKTYDQYIFLELSNGMVIDVFDYLMQVDQKMLGKTTSVTLLLFLSFIESLSEEIYDVYPNPNEHRILTSGGHRFSGRINAIDNNHKSLVVDIGVGNIEVDPSPLVKWSFSIGEFIHIRPSRVDLVEIIDYDTDDKNCGSFK